MRGGEEDIDDDDQLIDRGLDCPEFALLYARYRVSFWFPSWIGRLYVSRYRPCKLQLMMMINFLIVHLIVLNTLFYMIQGFFLVSCMDWSSTCLKVSSMQASVDDDYHLIVRPPDCPEIALLYVGNWVSSWFPPKVVYVF